MLHWKLMRHHLNIQLAFAPFAFAALKTQAQVENRSESSHTELNALVNECSFSLSLSFCLSHDLVDPSAT